MVVLLVIVVLIILSLMFGGFQKGTKSGGIGPSGARARWQRCARLAHLSAYARLGFG